MGVEPIIRTPQELAAGYFLKKLDAEPAPLLLAFILSPMIEDFLRRTLILSDGDPDGAPLRAQPKTKLSDFSRL